MPLRVFMMGMAFKNSGSRQLLLDAVVEMDEQIDKGRDRQKDTDPA